MTALPRVQTQPEAAGDLRVAIISDAIQNRNGVGTYYVDLVAHLRERAGGIRLLAPSMTAPESHQSFGLPLPGDPTQRFYLPRFRTLYREVRHMRPHVIVVPTYGPYGFFGLALARAFRIPACVAYHTDFESLVRLYWDNWVGRCISPLFRFVDYFTLRRSSVVALNEDMAERARSRGARTVHHAATPIAPSFFENASLNESTGLRSVLYLGRLAKEKRIEDVVQAARENPNLKFIVAGDGPLRKWLLKEQETLPNLDFRGWLERDAVVETVDKADLLVLPSSLEVFGTVALEAMARGTLVLTSAACGINRWPQLMECIFSLRDGESLSHGIARVAAEPEFVVRRCKENGIRAAESMNGFAVIQWLEILESLRRPGAKKS